MHVMPEVNDGCLPQFFSTSFLREGHLPNLELTDGR